MNAQVDQGLTSLRMALQPLRAAWGRLAERERRLLQAMAWVLGLFLLWTVAVQPAWRTVREAPARMDRLDAQLQAMQALAVDVRDMRATPALPRAQASAALKAASARLGAKGRLIEQGDRAVLTLTEASGDQVRAWLGDVRTGARARAVEANLTRSDNGLSGTVVVAFPSGNTP